MPLFHRLLSWGALAVIVVVIAGSASPAHSTSFANAPDVTWGAPASAAVHNLGPLAQGDDQRSYECTPLSYRQMDDLTKTMRPGCFVRTAFGLLDPDLGMAIFNGTDEAEPLRLGGQIPAISALPDSVSVARFGGFPGLGTYMYLYPYFPADLQTARDLHLQRYKELAGVADFTVKDASGQPLTVNPSALAYAARGQWMVTESPAHALVRLNLATFSLLPFAPSYFTPGNPYATHIASLAITEDGRYAAEASNEFTSFKVYDLAHCSGSGGADGLTSENCSSHDYWHYLEQQVTGELRSISHVSFVSDMAIRFDAVTSTGTETYLLSPDGSQGALIPYLGIGDSFASGQGAFDYITGTDTSENVCHLSVHSYPLRLSNDLFGNQGHSVACSGATTHDIGDLSAGYTGQNSSQRSAAEREGDGSEVSILHDFTPGYLAQARFATSYQPGIMTVQVGGNDAGFKDMLLRCLSRGGCYTSYEDRLEVEQTIDRTYAQWLQLYRQLQRSSPQSKLYAIGYPQIVSAAGRCGLNTPLNSDDVSFARDVTSYLNSVIKKAAQAAGITYVDVADALAGHELCDGSRLPAVNGLTAGTDIHHLLGQESFHPTAYGHELLEQAIIGATRHFTLPNPLAVTTQNAPLPAAGDSLLKAPVSGRSVRTIVYDSVVPTGVVRGSRVGVTVQAGTLAPSSTYTVSFGGQATGSITSNDHGGAIESVIVPITTPGGIQPVDVTGPGTSDTPITVTDTTYVTDQPDDYDTDGIPNSRDSCPLAANSGIDADNDHIDDVCDSAISAGTLINDLPAASPPAQSSPTTDLQPAAQSAGLSLTSSGKIAASTSGAGISLTTKRLPNTSGMAGHRRATTLSPTLIYVHWIVWLTILLGSAIARCFGLWLRRGDGLFFVKQR